MTGTHTRSETKTETFVRLEAIKNQYSTAFQRIMDYTYTEAKPILDLVGKQKIQFIKFWAYIKNNSGKKKKIIELTINVDWKKHQSLLLTVGNDEVTFNKNWAATIPEITSTIGTFENYLNEYKKAPIYTTFTIRFINVTHQEFINYKNQLHLEPSKYVEWNSNNQSTIKYDNLHELDEMSLDLIVDG